MPRRIPSCRVAVVALACTLVPIVSFAQALSPGDVAMSASVTGIHQFATDLDGGGDFRWSAGIASGTVMRAFNSQFSAGLTLRYDTQDWKFSQPTRFGGTAPWDRLIAPSAAMNFSYAVDPDLQIGVSPEFGWSYESGAKTSGASIYGALLKVTRVFSPDLLVGVGASVFRKLDETKVIPYVIVRWQISEQWRLGNPFAGGPAGGAGLELVYKPEDGWEIAGGGAKRSTRFRLDDEGAAPGGIAANRFYSLFARVTRNFGIRTNVDFYAGVALGGRLQVIDTNGTTVASDDYATAPLVGLTLAHRF